MISPWRACAPSGYYAARRAQQRIHAKHGRTQLHARTWQHQGRGRGPEVRSFKHQSKIGGVHTETDSHTHTQRSGPNACAPMVKSYKFCAVGKTRSRTPRAEHTPVAGRCRLLLRRMLREPGGDDRIHRQHLHHTVQLRLVLPRGCAHTHGFSFLLARCTHPVPVHRVARVTASRCFITFNALPSSSSSQRSCCCCCLVRQ